jgi:gas vesicle protein
LNNNEQNGSTVEGHSGGFLKGLMLGAMAGAGAMLLYAPQSGKKTRHKLQRTRDALRHQAVDAGEAVEDMVAKAGDKARDTAEELQARGGEMLDNGKARINAAVDAGKAAVHRVQA